MDIKEKMNLCLSDELLENTVLSENEKKVLAALLYSYKVCSKSHDGEIIRTTEQLRKESQIRKSDMYDALRKLDKLYHMVERVSGESRTEGKAAKASVFKLNFKTIFNPPKTPMKFNFFEETDPSETSMGTATTIPRSTTTTIPRSTTSVKTTTGVVDQMVPGPEKKKVEMKSNDIDMVLGRETTRKMHSPSPSFSSFPPSSTDSVQGTRICMATDGEWLNNSMNEIFNENAPDNNTAKCIKRWEKRKSGDDDLPF